MSPIIGMVEGREGVFARRAGGGGGLSFFEGRGVLVRGLALPAFLCPEGCEVRESAVGGGGSVGRLRSSNEFAFPDRGFSGALSVGRALPPRTGEGPAGGPLARSVGGSG